MISKQSLWITTTPSYAQNAYGVAIAPLSPTNVNI